MVLTVIVHSVLGERLIFQHLRASKPEITGLNARRVGILWATWHGLSVFGVGFSAVLFQLAASSSTFSLQSVVVVAIIASMLVTSSFVFVGTRAKHPGWIALLTVAVLLLMA